MTMLAMKRGLIRKSIGSAAHMRSASICSVTTIEPISAAMPAPTRVASMSAPSEAAKSRTSSSRYVAPSSVKSGTTRLAWRPGLVDEDHPDEAHRDRQEEHRAVAHLVHLADERALLAPPARHVVERADEDRVELARRRSSRSIAAAPSAPTAPMSSYGCSIGSCDCRCDSGRGRRVAHSAAQREAREVVEDEDAGGARHDRGVDGASDARRAALGREAEVAARERR